jgi:hypothetical protein
MKKIVIAALLGLSIVPTAAQANPKGATYCPKAHPGNGGWLQLIMKFCKY